MKIRNRNQTRPGPGRWSQKLHRFGLIFSVFLLVAGLLAGPGPSRAQPQAERRLVLSDVVIEGAGRTPRATILRHLGLEPGQTISQDALLDGVARLRDDHLFADVQFFTRPGPERGQLDLVLEVQEHAFNFRWGVGNTDIDGWYVAPFLVERRNFSGRADLLRLEWRLGFRHSGAYLRYQRPLGLDGRRYSETRLAFLSTDRPYFSEGVEYRHQVDRGELGYVYGLRLSENSLLESGLTVGTVESSHYSTAYNISPDGSIEEGDEIPLADQPPGIAAAEGRSGRIALSMDWQRDTRGAGRRAGTPTHGTWGRIKGTLILQEDHSHPGLQADLRAYREIPGGVLAGRVRGAWVGRKAAFYDRLYLGGMHTVRGFLTHSLSAPVGDTWLLSASLEYRSRIMGEGDHTSLAGLFFLDAGLAGADDVSDPYDELAASLGYGVRFRIPWFDWVGVDVGFPLTDRPLDMRFQANASIGWSF